MKRISLLGGTLNLKIDDVVVAKNCDSSRSASFWIEFDSRQTPYGRVQEKKI